MCSCGYTEHILNFHVKEFNRIARIIVDCNNCKPGFLTSNLVFTGSEEMTQLAK